MDKNIRLLFMDVDGTMTDGKIYMGPNGEVMKAFDIKDGYGIHEILPQFGIVPVIITGRTSKIVERRAAELGIKELYQGKHNKTDTLLAVLQKYGLQPDNAAYIGDDVLDKSCMELCGVTGCPSDAVPEIKAVCDYVCKTPGGHGAVREFIEWLIRTDKD